MALLSSSGPGPRSGPRTKTWTWANTKCGLESDFELRLGGGLQRGLAVKLRSGKVQVRSGPDLVQFIITWDGGMRYVYLWLVSGGRVGRAQASANIRDTVDSQPVAGPAARHLTQCEA